MTGPDTTTPAFVEVTQADREAAAGICHGFAAKIIREGDLDHGPYVQAFARHRLATTTEPLSQGASPREEGEDAALLTDANAWYSDAQKEEIARKAFDAGFDFAGGKWHEGTPWHDYAQECRSREIAEILAASPREEGEIRTPASIVRDFQTWADATYLSTKSRIDGGAEGLELPLAVAMGMSHQARQILAAMIAASPQASGTSAAGVALAEWTPEYDDRVRPLLLIEAGRREATEWNSEDAENVIAFLLSRIDGPAILSEDSTLATAREAGEVAWLPITDEAKSGAWVELVVDYSYGDHPLADGILACTIGFNSLADTGEDEWKFAGWCWSHDHFVEGKGTPIAWRPSRLNATDDDLPPLPARAALAGTADQVKP